MSKTLLIGSNTEIGLAIKKLLNPITPTRQEIDINSPIDYDFSNVDTVILNAYADFTSQLKTLYAIAEATTNSVHIVVLGSDGAYKEQPADIERSKYRTEKNALIKAGRDLNHLGHNVSILSPSTVNTARNENKTNKKFSTTGIAHIIAHVINEFKAGALYEHLVVRRI